MDDIQRALNYLFDVGEVFEVCLIGTPVQKHKLWDNEFAGGKGTIISGWFDNIETASTLIEQAEKQVKPSGVYITLNPCKEALLGRASNRFKIVKTRTADSEINKIKHILIDIDPKRPSGISASDSELKKALDLSRVIYSDLKKHGFPDPMVAKSGNGYHLVFKAGNDVGPDVIKGFLAGLSDRYSNEDVDVDTMVFNPARLIKMYGTTARKGEDIPGRPHRMSELVKIPESINLVESEKLIPFITEEKTIDYGSNSYSDEFDLGKYLAEYGVKVSKVKNHGSSTMHLLENCIFNENHTGNEAAIGQTSTGTLFYQCFHNSCQGKTWHEAREHISGNDKINSGKHLKANESKGKHLKGFVASSEHSESKTDKMERIAPVANLVREYVTDDIGMFTTYQIDHELCLTSRSEKNARSMELNRLQKQGLIKKSSSQKGAWRVVEGDLQPLSLSAKKKDCLPILLPLGLHEHAKVYPGNIIIVAGSPNAGKSAFVSTLIRECNNINTSLPAFESRTPFQQMAKSMCPEKDKPNVHFFSSEAGDEEMSARLQEHPGGIEAFKDIQFWNRTTNFADVIDPNGFNVIDYLEVYDNFYEIGSWINDIHSELDKGIAIIVLQKKRGADVAKGGDVTLEKPRLYITLENNFPHGGVCKIVKAKFPKDIHNNPNGKEIDYKLSFGWKFESISGLRYVGKDERIKINNSYTIKAKESEFGRTHWFSVLDDTEKVGLKVADYEKWQEEFSYLDLYKELNYVETQDSWMTKSKWFFQLSAYLRKRNEKIVPKPPEQMQLAKSN